MNRRRSAVTQATPRASRLALLTLALLVACDRLPFGYTRIAQILRAPGQYDGKTVKVQGRVKDAVKLPIADARYYVLDQDGATIFVIPASGVPAIDTTVSVVGTVSSPAIIGGVGLGIHLREQRRW
jgi:hypothetical protein